MKQKEQFLPIFIFVNNLTDQSTKWNDIPAVGRIDGYSYEISKMKTRLLRHQGDP